MHHIEILPAGSLYPIVKKYLINHSTPPDEYVLPVVANGNVYLMFTLAPASTIAFTRYNLPIKPCLAIGGQICREHIQVYCRGQVEFLFVELHPVALYHLYRYSAQIFTDQFTPLETKAETQLKEQLLNIVGLQTKIALVRQFLAQSLPLATILQDNIFKLTHWIEQQQGQVSVGEMSHRLGVSERQLQRLFLEKMGVSPKYYAKMVQMRQAINSVMSHTDRSLTDVVYERGHFDAAHFNKDFRRFLYMNPTAFLHHKAPLLKQLLLPGSELLVPKRKEAFFSPAHEEYQT